MHGQVGEHMTDQDQAEIRLLALDRAVGLANTGRIEPAAIIPMAEEFEDYLHDGADAT